MPVKAGQIDIEIRASAQRLRSDMDGAVKEVRRLGDGGREAGREMSKGMEAAALSVVKVAKAATEGALAVAGGHSILTAEVAKYSSMAASSGSTTEGLANSYRALRIALSPTPFTIATVAVGILAEETVRLVNARAKLIEQQSLIAAVSRMPIATVQRIDAVASISGGSAANVRSLSSTLSQRVDSNQNAVRSGLDTLGISSTEGRQGEALDPALLEHIAAAFASIEDPVKRAAAAVQIFGASDAATALKELDSSFVNASAAADKFGVALDSTSRNQIYQLRQEFVRLNAFLTEWGGMKAFAESFKTEAEIVVAATEDMAVRGGHWLDGLISRVPGMVSLRAAIHGQSAALSPSELNSGGARKGNISTGVAADDLFAEETASHQRTSATQGATLEGQRAAQAAAQASADSAYGSLSSDAKKRQDNPNDTTLLSNEQRFALAVQQQSSSALATAIGEKVTAMEAAAAAQKLAQAAAEQLAAFQGKAGERLQALADQIGAAAFTTPVASYIYRANIEIGKDSDKTTDAEKAGRSSIERQGLQQLVAAETAKWATGFVAELTKASANQKLQGVDLPSKDGSRDQVRKDDEDELRLRDAGERSARMATIQSQPGDEAGLAQRVLDIRLQTVAAERAVLSANIQNYDLEDLTLARKKLETEEANAQLTYENSIAEIEKAREQSALGAGGAYQLQLRAITQQLDALNKIQVTDKNIVDIELARVALAQKSAEIEIQRLLALGTLKDGWDAFWIEMDAQAEKPGKILFDGMNSALDKVSANLTKLVTGQQKKTTFGKDLESVGNSMVQSSMKALMQKGLGALGKVLGIKPPAGKPDGTPQNPYYVVVQGAATPSASGSGGAGGPLKTLLDKIRSATAPGGSLAPSAVNLRNAAAAPDVSFGAGNGGIIGQLTGNPNSMGHDAFGDEWDDNDHTQKPAWPFVNSQFGSQGIESVDSTVTFPPEIPMMAYGGDADPGRVYGVAEAGEAELISPKNSSRITPLGKLSGGTHTYNIDARGADLGAENRVARAIEYAHNSAVSSSVRANSERAKRTPKRSS